HPRKDPLLPSLQAPRYDATSTRRETSKIKRGVDERGRIGLSLQDGRPEPQARAPALRRLGMNTCENDPSITEPALDNSRGAVALAGYGVTPAGQLRAVFPIHIDGRPVRACNGDGCLADALTFERMEGEWDAGRRVETLS